MRYDINEDDIKILEKLIILSQQNISNEGLNDIMHFFNHDEYEMALEGLIIELLISESYPKEFEYSD